MDEILSVINRVDIPDNVIIPEEFDVIYGFKGFEKDMTCRRFQYEVGKDYEEKDAECCSTGFHFCKNPMDVLGYYSPTDGNGNLYEPSEKIPCPFCNKEEFFKHFDCEDEESMGKEVYESIVRWVKKHYPDYVIED